MNNRTYLAVNSYQDDFGEISRWRGSTESLSISNDDFINTLTEFDTPYIHSIKVIPKNEQDENTGQDSNQPRSNSQTQNYLDKKMSDKKMKIEKKYLNNKMEKQRVKIEVDVPKLNIVNEIRNPQLHPLSPLKKRNRNYYKDGLVNKDQNNNITETPVENSIIISNISKNSSPKTSTLRYLTKGRKYHGHKSHTSSKLRTSRNNPVSEVTNKGIRNLSYHKLKVHFKEKGKPILSFEILINIPKKPSEYSLIQKQSYLPNPENSKYFDSKSGLLKHSKSSSHSHSDENKHSNSKYDSDQRFKKFEKSLKVLDSQNHKHQFHKNANTNTRRGENDKYEECISKKSITKLIKDEINLSKEEDRFGTTCTKLAEDMNVLRDSQSNSSVLKYFQKGKVAFMNSIHDILQYANLNYNQHNYSFHSLKFPNGNELESLNDITKNDRDLFLLGSRILSEKELPPMKEYLKTIQTLEAPSVGKNSECNFQSLYTSLEAEAINNERITKIINSGSQKTSKKELHLPSGRSSQPNYHNYQNYTLKSQKNKYHKVNSQISIPQESYSSKHTQLPHHLKIKRYGFGKMLENFDKNLNNSSENTENPMKIKISISNLIKKKGGVFFGKEGGSEIKERQNLFNIGERFRDSQRIRLHSCRASPDSDNPNLSIPKIQSQYLPPLPQIQTQNPVNTQFKQFQFPSLPKDDYGPVNISNHKLNLTFDRVSLSKRIDSSFDSTERADLDEHEDKNHFPGKKLKSYRKKRNSESVERKRVLGSSHPISPRQYEEHNNAIQKDSLTSDKKRIVTVHDKKFSIHGSDLKTFLKEKEETLFNYEETMDKFLEKPKGSTCLCPNQDLFSSLNTLFTKNKQKKTKFKLEDLLRKRKNTGEKEKAKEWRENTQDSSKSVNFLCKHFNISVEYLKTNLFRYLKLTKSSAKRNNNVGTIEIAPPVNLSFKIYTNNLKLVFQQVRDNDISSLLIRSTFMFLKQRPPAVSKRIFMALGLNPQLFEENKKYSRISFEKYLHIQMILIDKTASPQIISNFIVKFFDPFMKNTLARFEVLRILKYLFMNELGELSDNDVLHIAELYIIIEKCFKRDNEKNTKTMCLTKFYTSLVNDKQLRESLYFFITHSQYRNNPSHTTQT